ncbi:MAG: hypothetical protein ABH986_02585 [archaeon]
MVFDPYKGKGHKAWVDEMHYMLDRNDFLRNLLAGHKEAGITLTMKQAEIKWHIRNLRNAEYISWVKRSQKRIPKKKTATKKPVKPKRILK